MENQLFEKFHFLLFDANSENINIESFTEPQVSFVEYYKNYNENFFTKKLLKSEFQDKWKTYGFIVKKFHQLHDNDLTNVFYENNGIKTYPFKENLKEENLNKFIKNFIKNNFKIIKGREDITSNSKDWHNADKIIPYKMFHKNLNIFEGYNYVNDTKINYKIDLLNTISKTSIDFISKYFRKIDSLGIINFDIFDKIEDLQSKYNLINNKISLLQRINELNIKNKKIFSLGDMIDTLEEKNTLSKKIIKEQNNIQNGILFLLSKNNL